MVQKRKRLSEKSQAIEENGGDREDHSEDTFEPCELDDHKHDDDRAEPASEVAIYLNGESLQSSGNSDRGFNTLRIFGAPGIRDF